MYVLMFKLCPIYYRNIAFNNSYSVLFQIYTMIGNTYNKWVYEFIKYIINTYMNAITKKLNKIAYKLMMQLHN